jgi:hypothetical protein
MYPVWRKGDIRAGRVARWRFVLSTSLILGASTWFLWVRKLVIRHEVTDRVVAGVTESHLLGDLLARANDRRRVDQGFWITCQDGRFGWSGLGGRDRRRMALYPRIYIKELEGLRCGPRLH